MTIRKFNKLYGHYKNNFDMQMMMSKSGMTYSKLAEKEIEDEEWL